MNPSDGSPDGMDQVGHLSDADLDRLLAGEAPSDADGAEALATFFHEVKSRYVTQPPPATRQVHLSQIVAAAQLNARRTQPSPQAGTIASPLTPAGIEAFSERHEAALFTDQEYRDAFTAAGLAVEHDLDGLTGRGLYIAQPAG